METEYSKYLFGIVAIIAVVALVYLGSQSIAGGVVSIEEKQCYDDDGGLVATAAGTCTDDYGIKYDACAAGNKVVKEFICTSQKVCEEVAAPCETGQVCDQGRCR